MGTRDTLQVHAVAEAMPGDSAIPGDFNEAVAGGKEQSIEEESANDVCCCSPADASGGPNAALHP